MRKMKFFKYITPKNGIPFLEMDCSIIKRMGDESIYFSKNPSGQILKMNHQNTQGSKLFFQYYSLIQTGR